ncbi:MAG: hypothetical protein KA330_10530 [Chitinophagaceae bacterium]|nr:hypothetical protein [Chitinophagaceae bacterium]
MKKPIKYLLGFFIFIGCAIYIFGIVQACIVSWHPDRPPYEIPVFLSTTVTSIAALLATNLGAVLGISITKSNSLFGEMKTWNPLTVFSDPEPTNFQATVCYVYVFSLVACGVVWAIRGFEPDTTKIVPLLPEMTKSLLGIIIGALAMALNIKATSNQKED